MGPCDIEINNKNRIQRRNSRFFTISSLRRETSPTRTLKWPGAQFRANHVRSQRATCRVTSAHHVQYAVLRVTWFEGTAQLLSMTEFKLHLLELYFIG